LKSYIKNYKIYYYQEKEETSKMRVKFPVKLENGLIIYGNEDSFLINYDPDFEGLSGNDANGDRVTHIVGFNGADLLKKCTNKDCRKIKPAIEGFGEKGRNSNPKRSMRRDQAQCIDCRTK
jgi:hypothetical protein